MGKPVRFSDLLRKHCVPDGSAAVASFESLDRLGHDYPEVAEALEKEAEHRSMKLGATLAMARTAMIEMVGEGEPEKKGKGSKGSKGSKPGDGGDAGDPPSDPPSP